MKDEPLERDPVPAPPAETLVERLMCSPVPSTIATDDAFRDVYCQGYRHALNDVLTALRAEPPPVPRADPQITCPLCDIAVRQVASATLDLALWQHFNWIHTAAAERAAPAPAPAGWQPIATAPKMQTILLFAVTDIVNGVTKNWHMGTGWWHSGFESETARMNNYTPWTWEGHQVRTYEVVPTHWMPLPAAPQESETP